ncbi:MAG: protein translocase subunit SecD [Alphaproteobacteria bacterium]
MQYTRKKLFSVIFVCLLGLFLALPNFISPANWPAHLFGSRFTLGLDLRGGSYLLLKVDTAVLEAEKRQQLADQVRSVLREKKIGFQDVEVKNDVVNFALRDAAKTEDAKTALNSVERSLGDGLSGAGAKALEVNVGTDGVFQVKRTEVMQKAEADKVLAQAVEIVRRRIDQTGVSEPVIARQGGDRILVQLPGVQDPERIKKLLGTTAKMNFHLVDMEANPNATIAPPGSMILETDASARREGKELQHYVIRRKVEVSGGDLTNASAGVDPQSGAWVVNFQFNGVGEKKFAEITKANVGKPFAVVLDNKVITAPVIREAITGGRGQISGDFSAETANDLAVLLRAGALPAPMKVVEERTVGPDLGADAIKSGMLAAFIGVGLVVIYMLVCYGFFGVLSNIALVANIGLLLGGISLLQATLTLPGIAGILLTIGMAVDGNLLINERIRDEIKKGRSVTTSVQAGFSQALGTIVDANVTTLICMALLYMFGSGPVRGFAVTISVGILTTLFSSLVVYKLFVAIWIKHKRPKTIPV